MCGRNVVLLTEESCHRQDTWLTNLFTQDRQEDNSTIVGGNRQHMLFMHIQQDSNLVFQKTNR